MGTTSIGWMLRISKVRVRCLEHDTEGTAQMTCWPADLCYVRHDDGTGHSVSRYYPETVKPLGYICCRCGTVVQELTCSHICQTCQETYDKEAAERTRKSNEEFKQRIGEEAYNKLMGFK